MRRLIIGVAVAGPLLFLDCAGFGEWVKGRWFEIEKQPTELSSDTLNADTIPLDSTSIGSDLSLEQVQLMIDRHNQARSDVGVGPVLWSADLARFAQEWANHLASTDCQLTHRPRSGEWKSRYGENLFMGPASVYGVDAAVDAWVDEKELYHGKKLNKSNWYDSGHYTQVVWRNTSRIGCAAAICGSMVIVVCNYDPPGNVMGQKPY